jgi:DNA-binding MarR family transcriptional regulator
MHKEPIPGEPTPARMLELPTWLIDRVSARSHRLLFEAFAGAGARGYHYRLLVALDEFGPLSQVTLGNRTGIDRSDVVAALNELAERGSVQRSPDPDDRRRNVVTITPAGVRELRALDRVVVDVQEQLLAPLSPADREAFVHLLSRLLNRDGGGA